MRNLSLTLLVLLGVFSGCSTDDDVMVEAPELSYSETEITTELLLTGSSDAASIEWNGDIGSLSLSGSVDGLSVDSEDGTIRWTEDLPLGTTNFSVTASNSAGQSSVELEIVNYFAGDFSGGWNANPNSTSIDFEQYDLFYYTDGTLAVSDQGLNGTGTWDRDENVVISVYTYENGFTYSSKADLSIEGTKAILSGFWYNGRTVNEGEEQGYFEVEYSVAN